MAAEVPAGWRRIELELSGDRSTLLGIVQAHENSVPGSEPQTEDLVLRELSGTDSEPTELYVVASREHTDSTHEDVLLHLQFLNQSHAVWVDVYGEPHVSVDFLTRTMDQALAYARGVVGDGDWMAETGCYGGDVRAAAFYRASGFTFERNFLRMSLDFTGQRPEPGPLPAGVSVAQYSASDLEGQRIVHALREETFRDHWNNHAREFDDWLEHMSLQRDPNGTRRCFVLSVAGDPAGLLICDDSRAETNYGFVGVLGVRRQYRGRGLAKWLLRRGFADAFDQGYQGVQLTVDSESPTGADRLYRSVGMYVSTELHAWRRPLPAV